MGKGKGITLTVPSGFSVDASTTYRYVLVIDANAGTWIEGRAHAPAPIAARIRRMASPKLLAASFVFDTQTGDRTPASVFRRAE